MTQLGFADAALVIIGHGTNLNADSAAPVCQQAAELRRRRSFASVHEAFWKQEPQVGVVLAAITARKVFIVPLFISEGYFSQEIIPAELGFAKDNCAGGVWVRNVGEQRWFYTQPVGTHPAMTDVLLVRARTIVEQFPFPRAPRTQDTTLFLLGHGTEQNDNSSRIVQDQASRIQALGIYAEVQSAFLDQEPRIAGCYQSAKTRHVVLVPFFMSNGLHVREDIPVLLGEPKRIVKQRLQSGQPTWRNPTERCGKLVWYAPSVGTEPKLADVILERVREADRR